MSSSIVFKRMQDGRKGRGSKGREGGREGGKAGGRDG